MADDDNSGGDVPPAPREEEAAAAAAEPPPSSSSSPSTSSSSSLLSLSVKNPARSCAPDFVLTARADDSVAELKAKLSQTYEGKPPAERQTVRGRGVGERRRRRKEKNVFFSNGTSEIDRSVCLSLINITFLLFACSNRSSTNQKQLIYAGKVLKDDAQKLSEVLRGSSGGSGGAGAGGGGATATPHALHLGGRGGAGGGSMLREEEQEEELVLSFRRPL